MANKFWLSFIFSSDPKDCAPLRINEKCYCRKTSSRDLAPKDLVPESVEARSLANNIDELAPWVSLKQQVGPLSSEDTARTTSRDRTSEPTEQRM